MEVKSGYQQTEVGVIPKDWEVQSFEKLAHIERGKFTARPRNDPKYYGGDIPFIQTGDVRNADGRITTYSQTLNSDGLKVSKTFPRGTLFFTIAANIGDVGFATFDAACPDSLVAITPAKKTDITWLAYELAKRKTSFESIATHNAQLNINLEKLRPYLLPVPPLPEQRAIAEALGDVDKLLGALGNLIAKKRDLKQAAMQQLLTGKKRLAGFHDEWAMRPLATLAEKIMVGIASAATHAYRTKGVPMFRNQNIKPGYLDDGDLLFVDPEYEFLFRNKRLRGGDLLTARTGYPGTTCVVPSCYESAQSFTTLITRPKQTEIQSNYLCCYINSEAGQRFFTQSQIGGAQKNVNAGTLRKMPIPVPPLPEQIAIAEVLSDMDAELAALEQRRAKTHALKQGMMQELLTGRTRLV